MALPVVQVMHKGSEFYPSRQMLPEVQSVGWARVKHAEPMLREHAHRGYEICYLLSGRVEWCAPEGISEVREGDIYLTRPGERHGGLDSMIHPCEVCWLIIDIPQCGALPGLTEGQTRHLHDRFAAMKLRTFAGSRKVYDNFNRMLLEHRHSHPLSGMSARAALHGLLMDVMYAHDRQVEQHLRLDRLRHQAIRQAVRHIEERPADNWSVEELGKLCGLAVNRFHALFVEQTGLSPAEYRTRKRVQDAKQLLRETNIPITELSYKLGYSSSQYFATVFKNFTGMAPKEYRQCATAPQISPSPVRA
jgi:AraC-like DNA-binding protein